MRDARIFGGESGAVLFAKSGADQPLFCEGTVASGTDYSRVRGRGIGFFQRHYDRSETQPAPQAGGDSALLQERFRITVPAKPNVITGQAGWAARPLSENSAEQSTHRQSSRAEKRIHEAVVPDRAAAFL